MENYFSELNNINVSEKTEKKNGMTYLSWSYAWGEVKKKFPDTSYIIYENKDGLNYHTDGKTAWVKTGVTVNGIENIEYLPIMDFKNKSIPLEQVTSIDVTKAIQRSLTKAIARHGLGLYIYAGEELPENMTETATEKDEPQKPTFECAICGKELSKEFYTKSIAKYHRALCSAECKAKADEQEKQTGIKITSGDASA